MISSLSIVIPVYNESNRIISTLRDVFLKISFFTPDFEIIVVDDGSIDDTLNRIQREFSEEIEKSILKCVRLRHQGKGLAVKNGMLVSQKDWVLFMDADNSASINNLNRFLPFIKQYEIIIGSRATKDRSLIRRDRWYRKIMGTIFNFIVRIIIKINYSDTQCGFKLFAAPCVQLIFKNIEERGFAFDIEVLSFAKLYNIQVKEVGINWANSNHSSVSLVLDPWRMLYSVYRIRSRRLLNNKELNKY